MIQSPCVGLVTTMRQLSPEVAPDQTTYGTLINSCALANFITQGAGLLEKTIGNRRPGYAAYVASTNAFFPGPPRKPSS